MTTIQNASLVIAVVLVSVACIWLVMPFYGAILWGVVLAILFRPLHLRLLERIGRPGVSAALTLLACIFLVVIPGAFILAAFVQQAGELYTMISTREVEPGQIVEGLRNSLPAFLLQWLQDLDIADFDAMRTQLNSFLAGSAQFLASRLLLIGQGTARLLVSLGVMLYLLFFLFRDGSALVARIKKVSPLAGHHTEMIAQKFVAVVHATIRGNVIIAATQGMIGGITFWTLGLGAPVLAGVLMGVLSLLPAVGAFLVWMPVAIWLFVTGQVAKAVILACIGIFIIGLIDNLLRPPLVGKGTRLPDYAILISTLGGISLLGMNGFIVGPLIMALFVSVWSLFAGEDSPELPLEEPKEAEPPSP